MNPKGKRNSTLDQIVVALALTGLIAFTAGCGNKAVDKPTMIPLPAPSATAPAPPAQTVVGAAQAVTSPHGTNPHGAMIDAGSATTLSPTPDLDAEIAKLSKSPGSAKELSAVYGQRGDARMMDPVASPHIKYGAALSDYRKALALDPTNKQAASNKAMIESIYRGLGRPIPTD